MNKESNTNTNSFDTFIRCQFKKPFFRSNCLGVFCKKGVLRDFGKFTGKYLCQSLFFEKVAGLGPATLLKKRHWYMCFPVNFAKCLRTPFLKDTFAHFGQVTVILLKFG